MANPESTKTYKIPLKSCQNSMINHDHVTVTFGIEWPPIGGDNPTLVINIANKLPSMSYFQQSHQTSFVNSVYHQQQQESVNQAYQQQQQQQQQQQYYHMPGMNGYESMNSSMGNSLDHMDVPMMRTTTTIVHDTCQTQQQPLMPSTEIERIKLSLEKAVQFNSGPDSSRLSSQYVSQASLDEQYNPRLSTTMLNISPASSMSSVIAPPFDASPPVMTPCPTPTNLQARSVLCFCPTPTLHHEPNCPVRNPGSNTRFLPESMHQSLINRTDIQHNPVPSQTHFNSVLTIPTLQPPIIATTRMPVPNHSIIRPIDPSSSITTIISPSPSFINNTAIDHSNRFTPVVTNGPFQQQSYDFSQVVINNQPYCQTHTLMPMIGGQTTGSTKTRQRKKATPKRAKAVNKTLTKLEPNSSPPNPLPSSIIPDNLPVTDNTLPGLMNDSKTPTPQHSSPLTNTSIRSPVELLCNVKKNSTTTEIVEEVINDVLQGQGKISGQTSPLPPPPPVPQAPKRSIQSQIVFESNGPVNIKTNNSPPYQGESASTFNDRSIVEITEQGIFPSRDELDQMNNTKKKTRLTSTNSTTSPIRPPSVTSTSNIGAKSSPHSDTLNPLLLGDSGTIPNHFVTDGTALNRMQSNDQVQVISTDDQDHPIEFPPNFFSPKSDKCFDSPLLSFSPMKGPSNTNDPFEDFFSSFSPSSNSGENQVTSTVMLPSDPPTNNLFGQQLYSQNIFQSDENLQTQTHPFQYPETNLNNTRPMNNNDDVQRSTKSSKPSKKSNRSTPVKKSSSSSSSKLTCTRCGFKRLIDITQHEFPKQKGLLFECASCGNNSLRSNVSADERKRRLAKVAADHLTKIECNFCRKMCHSHNEYINHLQVDHESTKPM